VGAFRGLQLDTVGNLIVYDSHSLPAGLTILQRFLGCFGHLLSKWKLLWMKNWEALSYLELLSKHFSQDSEESHGNINPYTSGSRIELGTFNSTGTTFVWMSKGNEKYHYGPG